MFIVYRLKRRPVPSVIEAEGGTLIIKKQCREISISDDDGIDIPTVRRTHVLRLAGLFP